MSHIHRLLIANRGEIARRVIRTAHEMGITTVAVYSEGDAGAPFVTEAATAIALAGRSATETYLNAEALLDAARRSGADAVHPGYGFLSENAAFARAVRDAGLIFVGPSADVIETLGDKLRAKSQVQAAGVPILESIEIAPGEGDSSELGGLPYPVMIKAAAGGGGKGMRVVRTKEDLPQALAAAAREAQAAFGDDRLFLEAYLERARHVEIQILGDSHGNLLHCYERECSIQRRHQKIIEEAPSPAVSEEIREQMCAAALSAGRAIGYENAGTVEFLLGQDGRYFFLEVNTRLQVEHPVTEAITGLDLVRQQLLVAEGSALSFAQEDLHISGHAIEARLYAEDPDRGFLPAAGRVETWRQATDPKVRYDSGVETGTVVGVEFDPMLAKVISHAATRREAAARLALALERTAIHGVVTNREFLVSVLRDEVFLAGDTTTAYLEERAGSLRTEADPAHLALAGLVAALSSEQENRRDAGVLCSLPSGWRMSAMPPEARRYRTSSGEITVEYHQRRSGEFEAVVRTDDDPTQTSEHRAASDHQVPGEHRVPSEHRVRRLGGTPEQPDLEIDGRRCGLRVDRSGVQIWVDLGTGPTLELTELPRFPERERAANAGALVAPMPGTVLSVHVALDEEVQAGQLLVIVEAMKMEHRITASVAGRIRELRAAPGDQVATGDLLVTLDAPHPADPPLPAVDGDTKDADTKEGV